MKCAFVVNTCLHAHAAGNTTINYYDIDTKAAAVFVAKAKARLLEIKAEVKARPRGLHHCVYASKLTNNVLVVSQ